MVIHAAACRDTCPSFVHAHMCWIHTCAFNSPRYWREDDAHCVPPDFLSLEPFEVPTDENAKHSIEAALGVRYPCKQFGRCAPSLNRCPENSIASHGLCLLPDIPSCPVKAVQLDLLDTRDINTLVRQYEHTGMCMNAHDCDVWMHRHACRCNVKFLCDDWEDRLRSRSGGKAVRSEDEEAGQKTRDTEGHIMTFE